MGEVNRKEMNSKAYNKSIQGLRAIALISILVYHYFFRYEEIFHKVVYRSEIVKAIPLFGLFIFCLISGYFIDTNRKQTINITFLRNKIIRLWIPYVISISVIFFITSLFRLEGRVVTIKDYLLNIPFVNGYIGTPYVDSSHWYLTTLISASVIVYAIKRVFSSDKLLLAYLLWLLVVYFLLLLRSSIGGNRYLTFILTLLGGEYIPVVISGIIGQRVISSCKQRAIGIICISTSIVYVLLYFGVAAGFIYCLCILLLFMALYNDLTFAFRPLVLVGNISFYVYLLHQNIGYIIINRFENVRPDLYFFPRIFSIFVFLLVGYAFSKLIVVINQLNPKKTIGGMR